MAEHRREFPVRAMCRCLRIQPSGFYAWLKNPLSRRAREDARQIELLDRAWKESGRVYGYRKLHDDLLDQGETSCANRIARLARLAGIKAQIRQYHLCPGVRGRRHSDHPLMLGPELSVVCRELAPALSQPADEISRAEMRVAREHAQLLVPGDRRYLDDVEPLLEQA